MKYSLFDMKDSISYWEYGCKQVVCLICFLFLCGTINISLFAQNEDEDIVFVVVEKMPKFPGGQQALYKYLSENVQYPDIAQNNGVQGRAICQFIVNADGSVRDVEIVRSSGDQSLDNEAIRVISSMPNWEPGMQRGKFVRVKYTLPVNFKLTNKQNTNFASSNQRTSKPQQSTFQPPLLALIDGSLSLDEPSKNNRIDADEQCKIRFKIQNNGKGVANNCEARVKLTGMTNGISVNPVKLPSIAVGQTYEVIIPIRANINTQTGKVTMSVEVYEPNGWGIAPFDLTVATKAYDPPYLQVVDYNVASNSGKVRKMEPFTLTFNLQNTKYGDAEKVKVKVNLPNNLYVMDGSAELEYPLIKSGEVKPIQLTLAANNNYPTANIPITIDVKEKHGKFAENRNIDIALNQVATGSVIITAKDEPQQERKEIKLATIGSAVDKNIPVSQQQNKTTFAVIIANENYQQVAKVPFALNDGNIFKQYCEKTLGIPSQNIHFVGDATINNIKQQVNWLSQVIKAYNGSARVIFYYAGHGVPDEKSKTAFLLPVDGNGTDITTGYKLDDLYSTLGALPTKAITIFLDACFSGSKREEGMLASARGVAIKVNKGQPTGNMVVFSAATGDETAYPNNQEGHGMFTYFLLKKLQESKGNVNLQDLGNYVTTNVTQQSVVLNGKSQTPTITVSPSVTDWQTWKLK